MNDFDNFLNKVCKGTRYSAASSSMSITYFVVCGKIIIDMLFPIWRVDTQHLCGHGTSSLSEWLLKDCLALREVESKSCETGANLKKWIPAFPQN